MISHQRHSLREIDVQTEAHPNNEHRDDGPALSVTGVTRAHGARAVKWLADRSLLAFYSRDGSLNAFVFKDGREATYKAMHDALAATR